jgi:hypothetical protein
MKTRIKVKNVPNYELLKLGIHTDLQRRVTPIAVVKDAKGKVSTVLQRDVVFLPSLNNNGPYIPARSKTAWTSETSDA